MGANKPEFLASYALHLSGGLGHDAAPSQHDAAHSGQTGDGVGDGHEGGVQRGGHTPHGLVACRE